MKLRGKWGIRSKGVKGEKAETEELSMGNGSGMWRVTVTFYGKCEEKETRQLCGDQERNRRTKKKNWIDKIGWISFSARNLLAEAVTSVCLKAYSLLYKLFGLCSSFAAQKATALADANDGGYSEELYRTTKAPAWLKDTHTAEPSKGCLVWLPAGSKEKQGDGGSWGKDKILQLPPLHWNAPLHLVSEGLQHWNISVKKSPEVSNFFSTENAVKNWGMGKLSASELPAGLKCLRH